MKKMILMAGAALLLCTTANAQFGKIGKALKDKAKQKVEQKVEQVKDKVQEAAGQSTPYDDGTDANLGTDEAQPQQFEKSPTEIDRERRQKIIDGQTKPAYEKVEAALKTLEDAVASGNDQYVWDDPAGNDAKRALNACLEIKNFRRDEPTFVAYKQRYFNAKQRAVETANLLSEIPVGLCHMDRTQDKEARLKDFYELMNWYIKTADAAPYARQKEFIIANASKDWKAFERERLMLFNNTTLVALRKKLDSYRLNIPADKSARISNKNAVTDPVDLYLMFFSITDYSNNDYSNDANVSPEHKRSMQEAAEYHAQYRREQADVEGLRSIKIYPGGAVTCKYGDFKLTAFNTLYDSKGNLLAKIVRNGARYELRSGGLMVVTGTIYPLKDGTWSTFYYGDEAGKIEKDGTVWFMDQKITKVDLNQISHEWVCLAYLFKLLRP